MLLSFAARLFSPLCLCCSHHIFRFCSLTLTVSLSTVLICCLEHESRFQKLFDFNCIWFVLDVLEHHLQYLIAKTNGNMRFAYLQMTSRSVPLNEATPSLVAVTPSTPMCCLVIEVSSILLLVKFSVKKG